MAFKPPTFNLSVNLWRRPNTVANPPDRTFMANLSPGKRVFTGNFGLSLAGYSGTMFMELLCPKSTDIAGIIANAFLDCVEVPAGSGRYYAVSFVDDCGKGFPNEYRIAMLAHLNTTTMGITTNPWAAPVWPVPIP